MITAAQSQLISLLIENLAGIDEARRRWEAINAPVAQSYGLRKQLLLSREWTADLVLEASGDVLVIDLEYGKPPRPATPEERKIALFGAIRRYPELLSLLPARPESAKTCTSCGGTGVLPASLTNPALRQVICQCGGAGWL